MNIKTKREVLIEALSKIKGVGDFQLIAETIKDANKKSRQTKVPTPDRWAYVSKLAFITVSLGNDYETEVNKQLEAEGKDASFKAKGTYCFPLTRIETGLRGMVESILKKIGLKISDNLSKIIYKHYEKDQLYLRVYPGLAKEYHCKNVYFDAHGTELTEEEFKAFEAEYLPPKSSAKQGGVEKKIIVNNYKIENVLYLGDNEINPINELTEEKLKKVA